MVRAVRFSSVTSFSHIYHEFFAGQIQLMLALFCYLTRFSFS